MYFENIAFNSPNNINNQSNLFNLDNPIPNYFTPISPILFSYLNKIRLFISILIQ